MITKESSSLVDSKKDGAAQPPILQLEEPSTQLSNQADDSGILTNPGDQISLQELNKNNGGGDESSRPTTSPQTASTQVASNRQLLGLEAEDDQSSAVQPSSVMTATMAGMVCSALNQNNPFSAFSKRGTDLGILIGKSQCGNFRIFLPLKLYVKSIWVILRPQNCHFDHLSSSEF